MPQEDGLGEPRFKQTGLTPKSMVFPIVNTAFHRANGGDRDRPRARSPSPCELTPLCPIPMKGRAQTGNSTDFGLNYKNI